VFENVGQRFLGDAVGREVDPRLDSVLSTAVVEVDDEACLLHLGYQQAEVTEAGLWRQLVVISRLTQHGNQPAQLRHRGAARRW